MKIDVESYTLPHFTPEDLRTTPDQATDKLNRLVDAVQYLIDNRA